MIAEVFAKSLRSSADRRCWPLPEANIVDFDLLSLRVMQKSALIPIDANSYLGACLQRQGIGSEDNFFDLGGDSLLAVQLF